MKRRLSISISVATNTIQEIQEHLDTCNICNHYGEAVDHLVKLARAYRKLLEHTRREKDAAGNGGC